MTREEVAADQGRPLTVEMMDEGTGGHLGGKAPSPTWGDRPLVIGRRRQPFSGTNHHLVNRRDQQQGQIGI